LWKTLLVLGHRRMILRTLFMTRTEIIERLTYRFRHWSPNRVDVAVRNLIDQIAETIAAGE
jgi:nucleoid DNA-binding protein